MTPPISNPMGWAVKTLTSLASTRRKNGGSKEETRWGDKERLKRELPSARRNSIRKGISPKIRGREFKKGTNQNGNDQGGEWCSTG